MIGILAIAFGACFLFVILAITFIPWQMFPLRREEPEEDVDWRNDLPDRWRLP